TCRDVRLIATFMYPTLFNSTVKISIVISRRLKPRLPKILSKIRPTESGFVFEPVPIVSKQYDSLAVCSWRLLRKQFCKSFGTSGTVGCRLFSALISDLRSLSVWWIFSEQSEDRCKNPILHRRL